MSWEQQSGNLHTNPGNRTPTTEDQIWPSTTFTSDWTFSLGPKAPVFPQSYSGYPVTNAGSTAVTSTAENPFEMSFGDVSIWDEWDSFEGYSSVANAPSRISPNESNESPFFPGVGQLAAESGRLLTTPPLFATLNQTVSPPIFAEPELPMTNQGPWFSVSSSAPGPGSRSPSTTVSPNPRVSSSVQNLSNKSPPSRKNATKSSRNSVKRPNVVIYPFRSIYSHVAKLSPATSINIAHLTKIFASKRSNEIQNNKRSYFSRPISYPGFYGAKCHFPAID